MSLARSAASEPQTEAAADAVGLKRMLLVTSARFAQWNGRGREGDGADRHPEERSKSRVGHGRMRLIGFSLEIRLLFRFPRKAWESGWSRRVEISLRARHLGASVGSNERRPGYGPIVLPKSSGAMSFMAFVAAARTVQSESLSAFTRSGSAERAAAPSF
jgi:hypothetical protein